MSDRREQADARLAVYDAAADDAAARGIGRYSTSFGLATRLLHRDIRPLVANIYALVRVADEIVDGAATEAGLSIQDAGARLDEYEAETERAIATGFSTDLVIHAFARVAREAGFGAELTAPFFESMRMDLVHAEYDREGFDRYVYGSAEVVGLMCLRVFVAGESDPARAYNELAPGARALGAAFQKVNFLRDLAGDLRVLGRSYFPDLDPASFTDAQKHAILDDIDADLALSAVSVPRLPTNARRAVALAQALYTELSVRLRSVPAAELLVTRVSVPSSVKARLAAGAMLGSTPGAPRPARTGSAVAR